MMAGDVPATAVHSDERVFAFKDINPQAPLHVLLVPRRHIETLNELTEADDDVVGELVRRAASIAKANGYDARGYRTVFNCNADAGQSVPHIHLHLLAGRRMNWPPG
jgi:histidine triad (HIT) family protein